GRRYFASPVKRHALQALCSGVVTPPPSPARSASVPQLISLGKLQLPLASCRPCASHPSITPVTSPRAFALPLYSPIRIGACSTVKLYGFCQAQAGSRYIVRPPYQLEAKCKCPAGFLRIT